MGKNVINRWGKLYGMFFFHFVSQEELIVSEVILMPCTKLIVRVSYLFAIFGKI